MAASASSRRPRSARLADRLFSELATSPDFTLVAVINDQPSFLGLSFPIGGSPHDWRYPAHEVTIYRRVAGRVVPSPYCFTDLHRAAKALYIPPSQRQ